MTLKWEVDQNTVVEARGGLWKRFGKATITVNGQLIPNELSLWKTSEVTFDLPHGRRARFSITLQPTGVPEFDLRVNGMLATPTGRLPYKCDSCGTVVKPYDGSCGNCGQTLRLAEQYARQEYLAAYKIRKFFLYGMAFLATAAGFAHSLPTLYSGLVDGTVYLNNGEAMTYQSDPFGFVFLLVAHSVVVLTVVGLSYSAHALLMSEQSPG